MHYKKDRSTSKIIFRIYCTSHHQDTLHKSKCPLSWKNQDLHWKPSTQKMTSVQEEEVTCTVISAILYMCLNYWCVLVLVLNVDEMSFM